MVAPPKPILVRQVWQSNLRAEFSLIQQSLRRFPYASMDTEFPGTVFDIPKNLFSSLSPHQLYFMMKQNVDALNLIQLGLTLSDAHGNLPHLGTGFQYVWEFNFRDFDCDRDLQNPESISLLRRQGINFLKNKHMGIDSNDFALLFKASGLGLSGARRGKGKGKGNLTWITFHGLYDFGYLIKTLTRKQLPNNLMDFMRLLGLYLGLAVYDLKPMARAFGLHGGLERVAKSLNLERVAGKSHQAGSDSLLTMQAFIELMNRCCAGDIMERFNYKLYGLTATVI